MVGASALWVFVPDRGEYSVQRTTFASWPSTLNDWQQVGQRRILSEERLKAVKQFDADELSDGEAISHQLYQLDLERGLESLRTTYGSDVELARELTADLSDLSDVDRVELAAWTMLMNSLFNLDEVKTRE